MTTKQIAPIYDDDSEDGKKSYQSDYMKKAFLFEHISNKNDVDSDYESSVNSFSYMDSTKKIAALDNPPNLVQFLERLDLNSSNENSHSDPASHDSSAAAGKFSS